MNALQKITRWVLWPIAILGVATIIFAIGFALLGWLSLLLLGYALFRWGPKLIAEVYVPIPAYHFGVRERFGERLPGVLFEGFHLKLPFVEKIELVSMELGSMDIPVEFTIREGVRAILTVTLQYRPDPRILRDGKVLFLEMSDSLIQSGIAAAVSSKIGGLGGVSDIADLVQYRQALGDIINAFLRLESPPHLRHHEICSRSDCNWADKEQVDASELVEWYNCHWRELKTAEPKLRRDPDNIPDYPTEMYNDGDGCHSEVENRYALDIEYLAICDIDWTPETKEALEQQQQVELRKRTGDLYHDLVKRFLGLDGVSSTEAQNMAQAILNPDVAASKKIVSVEGLDLASIVELLSKGDK